MKKLLSIVLSLVLVLGFSVTAFAAVSVNDNGVGFVGKGDVQLAFGWNNAQLQKNASGVTFTYEAKDTYTVTEEWDTKAGKKIVPHEIEVPKHVSVNATVAYDARVKNQINGFNLKGFGTVVAEGTVPVVGDPLTGNRVAYDEETQEWVTATVTNVELTKSTGGLYVNYGGTSVALPNTPVVTTVQ
jgi:hypothetical protein